MMNGKVVYILLISICKICCQEVWIDPHDMKVFKNAKVPSVETPPLHKNENSNPAALQLKRTVNLLLNFMTIDRYNDNTYRGYLTISKDKYEQLKEFAANDNNNNYDMNELDAVLSEVFKKSVYAHLEEYLFTWTDFINLFIFNKTTLLLIGCLFVLFISYKLLRANLSLTYITQYLFFVAIIVSFTFTWIDLYQMAEIDKMSDLIKYRNMPAECNPNTMTAWQYFWSRFSSGDECKSYHQVHFKDVFYSISPDIVLIEMATRFVSRPAAQVGASLGSFVNGILYGMPWPLNIVLLPIVLIFALLITCIVLSFTMRSSIKFNFMFNMLSFEFGKQRNQRTALHEEPHRRYVQNVSAPAVSDAPVTKQSLESKRETVVNDKTSVSETTTSRSIRTADDVSSNDKDTVKCIEE